MTPPLTAKKPDGRTRRAQEKRRLRREQLLQEAALLFAKRGFHNTSVSDLIVASGISRGTFYIYFDSKEALFHELLDGFMNKLKQTITVVDPSAGETARMEILKNIQRVVDLLFENRNLSLVLLTVSSGIDREADRKLLELHDFIYEMVIGALKNGVDWGLIRPCNERIVSSAIIGAVKEVLYSYLVLQEIDIPDRNEVAQALFDYGLIGLLPRS